jgi:hypothetical protein
MLTCAERQKSISSLTARVTQQNELLSHRWQSDLRLSPFSDELSLPQKMVGNRGPQNKRWLPRQRQETSPLAQSSMNAGPCARYSVQRIEQASANCLERAHDDSLIFCFAAMF